MKFTWKENKLFMKAIVQSCLKAKIPEPLQLRVVMHIRRRGVEGRGEQQWVSALLLAPFPSAAGRMQSVAGLAAAFYCHFVFLCAAAPAVPGRCACAITGSCCWRVTAQGVFMGLLTTFFMH